MNILKKTFILLLIATLPALAEPQFDMIGGIMFYIFVFLSKAFEFLSPFIFLIIIVVAIKKIFDQKK